MLIDFRSYHEYDTDFHGAGVGEQLLRCMRLTGEGETTRRRRR